jgi:diacylglycerol O-acyltransferase
MAELMRNSDAFSWQMEHEPGLRSTVVTIFVLDRAPSWDDLVDLFERMSATLPMFRERVVENLPPAPPRWEPDPDLDLDFPVHRLVAPSPGSFDEVLALVTE